MTLRPGQVMVRQTVTRFDERVVALTLVFPHTTTAALRNAATTEFRQLLHEAGLPTTHAVHLPNECMASIDLIDPCELKILNDAIVSATRNDERFALDTSPSGVTTLDGDFAENMTRKLV